MFYLVLIIFSTDLFAQWDLTFSTSQEYSTNPFRSPLASSDVISNFTAGLKNNLGSVNVLYFGNYNSFAANNERNYFWHQLGLFKEDSNYIFGIYGEQRINRSEYNFFNYSDLTGYYKRLLDFNYIEPIVSISTTLKQYNELSEYNNLLLNAGISFNKSFETKTTFLFSGSVNFKNYFNSSNSDILLTNELGESYYYNTGASSQVVSSQVFSNFRLAQSIFDYTGLAAYYTNRTLLNKGSSSSSDYNLYYGDESDLYDDPISRNENSAGFELTQILPYEIMIKTGYEYSYRTYPSQGIYVNYEDYLVDSERIDKQDFYYLYAAKSFYLDNAETYKLNVGLNLNYFDKKSNSYWYQFSGSDMSINLGLQF
jgi:hypothetical protein